MVFKTAQSNLLRKRKWLIYNTNVKVSLHHFFFWLSIQLSVKYSLCQNLTCLSLDVCTGRQRVSVCVYVQPCICMPAWTCNYRSGHIFAPCACQHICGCTCQAIGICFGVCVKVFLLLCGKAFKYSFQGSQAASLFCLQAALTKPSTQES